jgi:hypothetical protein
LPSRHNNYNTEDIPTQLRFLQWARNSFLNIRNSRIDEGVELREHSTGVVDVPLGQARPVSPFFPSGHLTLHMSCRGTTRRDKYRWRKRRQGMRGRRRNRRQGRRRILLRAAHGLPNAASTRNPVKKPRHSQLLVCISLVFPLRPHLPPPLRPHSPRAGLVSG